MSLGALAVAASLAYWAPNHEGMNLQVMREGKPWGDAFLRAQAPVQTANDYIRLVLYVNSPTVMARPGSPEKENDTTLVRCIAQDSRIFGVPLREGGFSPNHASDRPTDTPSLQLPVWCWTVLGGLWEDGFSNTKEAVRWGGRRAVNHFHDPITGTGEYTGLTPTTLGESIPLAGLLRKGTSVTKWVKNGHSGGLDGFNDWGFPTIGLGLHRAFTEPTLKKREGGLAAAFRSLGQVMHLIEDNTVPDHTRDLAHPGDGFEESFGRDSEAMKMFNGTPHESWVGFPVKVIAADGLRAFWDRDVYTGNPAAVMSSVTPGLSEYVQANFLAWNRFAKAGDFEFPGGAHVDFTTVPDAVDRGFARQGQGIGLELGMGLWFRSDNSVVYPWPRLANPVGTDYPSAPGTLPLPHIATQEGSNNIITDGAWKNYVAPLMARAHGYAESVVALALQPARAQVVRPAGDNPKKLAVQLWNLWPTDHPNAVSWHLDKLEVVVMAPDELRTNAEYDFSSVLIPDTRIVGPGQSIITMEVDVARAQRAAMLFASHTAVLVTAHLGNQEKTPVHFAVPIPNGYPLVTQTTTQDLSGTHASNQDCCPGGGCAKCGENGFFRNALNQSVTGTIDVFATEKDIFQRSATPEVKAALQRDTRIAAVELLAFSRNRTDLTDPLRPVNSDLTLFGGDLVKQNNGLWVRADQAPDVAPDPNAPPLEFTATIDFTDFFTDTGEPEVDAMRVSGSVFLGVWMTSGAVYYQRLVLWPIGGRSSASARESATRCEFAPPRGLLSEERTSLCTSSATSSMPCSGTQTTSVLAFSRADSGLMSVVPTDPMLVRQLMPFGHARATSFAGTALDSPNGLIPRPCTTAELALYPGGNGSAVCLGLHSSVNYVWAQNRQNEPGLCAVLEPPPTVNRTASYVRVFGPEHLLFQSLGVDPPAPPTFTLTSAP